MSNQLPSITIERNSDNLVLYSQVLDDDKCVQRLINAAVLLPSGDEFTITINNNGRMIPIGAGEPNIEVFVRLANGLTVRKPSAPKSAKAPATPVAEKGEE